MCLAVTIFLLTQSSKFGGPFRYLENVRKVHKKISRDLWKKVSTQNMRLCQNIPTPFWASFFQNLNFFHVSWNIIWLVCLAITIFYCKLLGSEDLSDTMNMSVKSTKTVNDNILDWKPRLLVRVSNTSFLFDHQV